MSHSSPQTFLRELDKKLWTAADKLRSNLDAAVYKHAVLGLIFLKYVSDSFAQRQAEIEAMLKDPENDFFVDPASYDKPAQYDEAIHRELEERDYYIEKNVFWVPALARWKTLQDSAKLPAGTEIKESGRLAQPYKITSTGKLIDDALEAVEKENPKLKNVLNKDYVRLQIPQENLAGLIDLIATIPFQHADLHAKDILGHVYEYFLGQFALAEGKKGGQYFTPKSIVSLIVEMIEPYQGRVYDPAMGSGGFFVQSERFIEEHGGKLGNLSVYGQESNPTTWRLAAMNMAIRGIDFNFGKEPANSFTNGQHPDLRADYVMANPPFTGSIDKGDINENLQLATTKTELLFVENIYRLLKKGGTACVIVPQGVLFGSGGAFKTLRQLLVERCDLKAVITLPSGVFKPYAGVSTAILLFTKVWGAKDKVTTPATDHVWFYEMAFDGYSLDDKRSKQDGYGDLQDIIAKYHARNAATDTDRTAKCFMVPRTEIADEKNSYDLSLSRYKTDVFEEVHYDAPGVILDRLIRAEVGDVDEADLAKVQSGIVRELLELKGMVG